MESELLKEVAGLAAGFSELEEQNNAQVDALIKKEDEIVTLQTEVRKILTERISWADTNDFIQKLKHSQAFTALNKSKDVFKLLSNQLQRQNEMQLEVIRQFNEHEKNMNAQLVSELSDLYITTPHVLLYSCIDSPTNASPYRAIMIVK